MSRLDGRSAIRPGALRGVATEGVSAPITVGAHGIVDEAGASAPPRARQRWWREVALAVAFYGGYTAVRDLHGSTTAHAVAQARRHGYAILHLERLLRVNLERGVQAVVLHVRPVVVAMDVFYGSLHFLLTTAVFFWLLFTAAPRVYRRARNVLAIATAIALVGFAAFPTMPPRLMPPGANTVDTLAVVGGLWSYNNGVIEHISDPFAAMPSLHVVWAAWVAYALTLTLPRSRWRGLVWAYPVVTSFVIIAAGTHWVLDLPAGALVFAGAVLVARRPSRGWAPLRPGLRHAPR